MKDIVSVSGNGDFLILVHGIGATRDAWNNLIPILERRFSVVRYDLCGHGVHPIPDREITLARLVEDLESIRQEVGIKQAHFAGHSLGGMIVPAYARNYPERVLSMTLLSTAAGRSEQDRENVWNVIRLMEQKSIAAVLPTLVERWFTDEFTNSFPEVVAARLQTVLNTDRSVFLNVFKIYADTEMLPWLREIKVPALVVTGENDGGCNPRLNRLIANELQNSKLVILPKYKHAILLEAGLEAANQICKFIENLVEM